jgi:hypothetical protein
MNSDMQLPTSLIEQSARYILSMHVDAYYFTLAVLNPQNGEVVYSFEREFKSNEGIPYEEAIAYLVQHLPNAVFNQAQLSIEPMAFNLVPDILFDESAIASYLPQVSESEFIRFKTNRVQNMMVVFAVSSSVDRLIQSVAGLTVLATPTLLLPKQKNTVSLHKENAVIFATKEKHYLLIQRQQEVLLLNAYTGNQAEDLLYFLANGCMQFGIDLSQLSIHLEGLHFESAYEETLLKYVRGVHCSDDYKTGQFSDLWKLHLLCA